MGSRIAKQRLLLAGCLALGATGLIRPAAAKQGLSTKFVEVLAEGVPLASRWVLGGKVVDVTNTGDEPVTVRFDGEVPSPGLLRAGYEPIPDAAWLSFEPRTVEVPAGETRSAKLVLYTPEDPALTSKRFQAMIRIRPAETAGAVGVAVGLLPRFMFSLEPKGAAVAAVKVVEHPRKLASVKPYSTAGRATALTVECDPVILENFQDTTVTYEYQPAPDAKARSMLERRPGDDDLDPAWIEVSPQSVVLPRLKMAQVAVRVKIPLTVSPFGRRFVGPMHWKAVKEGGGTVDVYNMVRVAADALPSGTAMAGPGSAP